jgi:hypothetical protein
MIFSLDLQFRKKYVSESKQGRSLFRSQKINNLGKDVGTRVLYQNMPTFHLHVGILPEIIVVLTL